MTSATIINIVSKVWAALLNIVLLPFYIKFLGAESYGLVAFYSTLLGSLALLDLGLSPTLTREIAIHKAKNYSITITRDLVFTVEVIYWAVGILIGILIFISSYPIAAYWVNSKTLSIGTIQKVIIIMGAVIVFQWPSGLYNGALIGIEKQNVSSLVNIGFTSIRSIGVFFILYISPTVEAYFYWQVFATFLYSFSLRYSVWLFLKSEIHKPRFSKKQLIKIWRFAAGMTGISLATFFISQIDKILVSKFLPLEQVGYYTIAFSVAGVISMFSGALTNIIYPKFTRVVVNRNRTEIISFYHQYSKWISVLSFPIGIFLIFFAPDILTVWTKNPILTTQVTPIMRVLAIGTLFNNMMFMPYYLMLSNGETKFTIYQNSIAAVLIIPFLIWAIPNFGPLGASYVWLVVNASYVLISAPLIFGKFLKGELLNWYLHDIVIPLILILFVFVSVKFFKDFVLININGFQLVVLFSFSLIFSYASIKESRNLLKNKFKIFYYAFVNYYTH